jgi:uncharacterized damage-inducible protein DinB
MTLSELNELLDYHYWARDRVLAAAESLTPEQFVQRVESSFTSVRDTLAHTYGADWIWYQRWIGASPPALPKAADFSDVASLRAAWRELEGQVRALVTALGESGIAGAVAYRTMDGTPSVQPFWQLVQHVVNHASYHRGQATTQLRQVGGAPPASTDMIAFFRERAATASS